MKQSTSKNYYGVWKKFNKFLIKLDKIPATWEQKVISYVGHLIDCGLQSQTIKSYMSGIKTILEQDGYEWKLDRLLFNSLMKSCKLENDRIRVRLPIQIGLLEILLYELRKLYKMQVYLIYLYTALFLLAYYGLLRIGELTRSNHSLKARDLYIDRNKGKLLIVLYSSKTHGKESRPQRIKVEGNVHLTRENAMKRRFCPYRYVNKFLELRGDYIHVTDNLFVFADNSPVQANQVRTVLRELLQCVGLDPNLYDTHSFRIGRATDLFKFHYSVDEIKHLGRWRSNAVYKYLRG